ncbi:S-layer homology domain-containing protein [Paenibacillus sp. 843]|uniref:S-layer homology domain-containing protein n=1 Tax=Paenibacillus sp. 843 TaxID=3341795 RepID=UPI00372A0051
MLKKNVALMLILLFILSPASVFAAEDFSLSLSASEVKRGDEITISGTVPVEAGDVVVKMVTPRQTVLYIDVIAAAAGRYSTKVGIPADEDLAPSGVYTVTAGTGSSTDSRTFRIAGAPVNPPGGGDGGDGGGNPGGGSPGSGGSSGGGGSVTPPPSSSGGIPAGAGSAPGSIIHPELTSDGRYIVGEDTMAEAVNQAKESVTIELPASAGESGSALELAAGSIHALVKRNLDLIVTSGNRTVRLPAGSIAVPNDKSALIRIVLKAAYTEEARALIQRSLSSKTDYSATDVVLSVVIQIVSGNNVTEVHNLTKPAVVSFKLTEAQEKQISSDLAGVYYVDGSGIEHVPGTLKNGTFIFMADHFSYYAVLEYNKSFIDMAGHWAEDAVKALAAKGLVTGVDERRYEPNRGITRAEFVTLIMRSIQHEGNNSAVNGANPFKDVPTGRYYTEFVTKAAALGIVSGYEGAFRPNDPITREEAVVSLIRAAAYLNLEETTQGESAFADAESISTWAMAAVHEAWTLGLIQGDGMSFNPKRSVTRAEVAVMIHRLIADRS